MVNTQSTPKLVVLLTGIAILGAFFPVYGIPFGPIKLTVFRLGVFPGDPQVALYLKIISAHHTFYSSLCDCSLDMG